MCPFDRRRLAKAGVENKGFCAFDKRDNARLFFETASCRKRKQSKEKRYMSQDIKDKARTATHATIKSLKEHGIPVPMFLDEVCRCEENDESDILNDVVEEVRDTVTGSFPSILICMAENDQGEVGSMNVCCKGSKEKVLSLLSMGVTQLASCAGVPLADVIESLTFLDKK